MERKLKEVKLDSAKTFSELYGLKDQSLLIGVIDFKTAQKSPNNLEMEYGVYALYLKDVSVCSLKYGAYPCDYTSGTLVMFAPGQRARLDSPEAQVRPDVIGLLFHLDLIEGTPLGLTMGKYPSFHIKRPNLCIYLILKGIFLEGPFRKSLNILEFRRHGIQEIFWRAGFNFCWIASILSMLDSSGLGTPLTSRYCKTFESSSKVFTLRAVARMVFLRFLILRKKRIFPPVILASS